MSPPAAICAGLAMLALAMASAGAAFSVLATIATALFLGRTAVRPTATPAVTILRPMKGLDVGSPGTELEFAL